jgi:glycosyltransferase involved in cell wall biosynthesis
MRRVDKILKKHILVISQYFYPEQFRINDICSEWIKRGYKVTVVTGIPNYPKGKYYEGYGLFKKRKETFNGIDIIRIPLVPRGNSSITLALNYVSFVVSGLFWCLFTRVKADYVFIFEVSPMTQALPGVWYAKKEKIPCYLYVQDLWPENFEILSGIKNKTVINMVGRMVDYIYLHCTKIFTTSRSFITSIANRGVPVDKIEYWPQYAEDFYKPLKKNSVSEIPNDGAFNIIFAGNIGTSQGLDILPKVAAMLKEENLKRGIRFNIVGDGRYKETLVDLVNNNNVSDMFNFIPKQPATRIPGLMAANDAAFICLTDSPLFSMTIPAKLQSYMACGIPIIASALGETNQIIEEANAGVFSPAGNAQKLSEVIVELLDKPQDQLDKLGINARSYYHIYFNKQEVLNNFDKYFGKSLKLEDEQYVQR